MKSEDLQELKPFVGIMLVISSMFFVVLAKMEERRMGYVLLKLTHEQRSAIELKREKTVALAKILRPQHVEQVAQDRFTLKKINQNQIIHLSGGLTSSTQSRDL